MIKFNPNLPRTKDMARRVWLTDNFIFGTQEGMANIPCSAFICRLLFTADKPINENLILRAIRDNRVMLVAKNIKENILDLLMLGIVEHAKKGQKLIGFQLTNDMKRFIIANRPENPDQDQVTAILESIYRPLIKAMDADINVTMEVLQKELEKVGWLYSADQIEKFMLEILAENRLKVLA